MGLEISGCPQAGWGFLAAAQTAVITARLGPCPSPCQSVLTKLQSASVLNQNPILNTSGLTVRGSTPTTVARSYVIPQCVFGTPPGWGLTRGHTHFTAVEAEVTEAEGLGCVPVTGSQGRRKGRGQA